MENDEDFEDISTETYFIGYLDGPYNMYNDNGLWYLDLLCYEEGTEDVIQTQVGFKNQALARKVKNVLQTTAEPLTTEDFDNYQKELRLRMFN